SYVGEPRDWPPFPTRRSSDLGGARGSRPSSAARGPRSRRGGRGASSSSIKLLQLVALWWGCCPATLTTWAVGARRPRPSVSRVRSEEHTSELQSRGKLVCRLL